MFGGSAVKNYVTEDKGVKIQEGRKKRGPHKMTGYLDKYMKTRCEIMDISTCLDKLMKNNEIS